MSPKSQMLGSSGEAANSKTGVSRIMGTLRSLRRLRRLERLGRLGRESQQP